MGKEVAAKNNVVSLFGDAPAWDSGSNRGNETVSTDDLAVPRVSIIQDLSPQHKTGKSEYIPGAQVGMCYNTATQKLYGTEIYIVPVYFRKEYIVWKDRKKGGGFFGSFDSLGRARAEISSFDSPGDYDIVDTALQFCLIIDPASTVNNWMVEQAVISMSKSQMKPSRQLNTMVAGAGGDRFSRVYKLSVVVDRNKSGEEFQNWRVTPMGYTPEPVYRLAEEFYDTVASGTVRTTVEED